MKYHTTTKLVFVFLLIGVLSACKTHHYKAKYAPKKYII